MSFNIALPYPDQSKASRGSGEDKKLITFDHWIHWKAWRTVAAGTPDGPPSEIALPWDATEPMIVDVRGCTGLLVAVSQATLSAAGLLVNVVDWSGRLWVCTGPPDEAQWSLLSGATSGAMGGATYAKFFDLFGVWYAAWQIDTLNSTAGILVSLRPI